MIGKLEVSEIGIGPLGFPTVMERYQEKNTPLKPSEKLTTLAVHLLIRTKFMGKKCFTLGITRS